MFTFRVVVALAVTAGLVACGQQPSPVAEHPQPARPPNVTTTSAQPPHPYRFGTPQAVAPPVVDGLVPVVNRIQTDKPYVFITIDDGAVRHPAAEKLMRSAGVRPTLFLNTKHMQGHRDYFAALPASVHSHTSTHPNLAGKPYELQRNEICGNADFIAAEYGKRPTLFRPPFGNHDVTTRRAAADCGFTALVMWTAAVNDGRVQFQAGDKLNRGDIVLMHFRNSFAEDFTAFIERAKQDGLIPVPLDDFLASNLQVPGTSGDIPR